MAIYQCKVEDRFKGITVFLILIVVLFTGVYRWNVRKGCFSFSNYQRITVGMTLAEVETLLGSNGKEEKEKYVPWMPSWEKMVWGDAYRKWGDRHSGNGEYILIGLKDGVVVSKYYFEYSL